MIKLLVQEWGLPHCLTDLVSGVLNDIYDISRQTGGLSPTGGWSVHGSTLYSDSLLPLTGFVVHP